MDSCRGGKQLDGRRGAGAKCGEGFCRKQERRADDRNGVGNEVRQMQRKLAGESGADLRMRQAVLADLLDRQLLGVACSLARFRIMRDGMRQHHLLRQQQQER